MSNLFSATTIKNMNLSNRFVRSATWEGQAAPDGAVTPTLINTMVDLAVGEVGLIITGHAYVRAEGQAGILQMGIHEDRLIPGLRTMTEAVHKYESKIIVQLAHGGRFSSAKITGLPPVLVSKEIGEDELAGHEITTAEIPSLIEAYAQAARRAREAGFDGVQIHSAHGYLLSQFLSPVFNQRQDQYGGDIFHRSRILLEILRAIREAVGEDYPILIKLNCQDFADNGLTLPDSVKVGRLLAEAGIDAIEISGGLLTSGRLSPSRPQKHSSVVEPYYLKEAREFKKDVSIPIILVGGIRSWDESESIINDGLADYIAMSRPFIKEPHIVKRWKSGNLARSECRSDNRCFRPVINGKGLNCENPE